MSTIVLELPDDLVRKLQPLPQERVTRALQLGLRQIEASQQTGYAYVADILEKLFSLPSAEEVLALRPSPSLQNRIEDLLEKNRTLGLNEDEEKEWQDYEYLEH